MARVFFARLFIPALLLAFFLVPSGPSNGHTGPQYRKPEPREPVVEALLYGPAKARAWIRYNGERFHALAGTRLDSEWSVEEIRRESVLFRRTSTRSFIEMPIAMPKKRPPYHHGWSLIALPTGLWEVLELLTAGFGHHVVMHHRAGGTITPCIHGTVLEQMLLKIMPRHHRFAFAGSVLLVLPAEAGGESWAAILARLREQRPEQLTIGFGGLKKPGTLLSRGDDIQLVLRQIALGGETPIQFPKGLHFPVYASFRNVPFCQILTKILYLNQCSIIVRMDQLEIAPITRGLPGLDAMMVGPFVSEPDGGPSAPGQAALPPPEPAWKPLEPPALLPTSAGSDSE